MVIRKLPDHKDSDWLYRRYTLDKKSIREIGIECSIHASNILYYMKKFNIPRRPKNQMKKRLTITHKHLSFLLRIAEPKDDLDNATYRYIAKLYYERLK